MDWFLANWQNITLIVTAAVLFAGRIVELTPTQVDNAVLAKVVGFLKVIGLKVGE